MEQLIRSLIQNHLELEEITNDTDEFISDLGVDSLEVLEMILMLEEEFDIEIPDEEAEELKSIDAVIKYMARI
jgi:acyl carrier protein